MSWKMRMKMALALIVLGVICSGGRIYGESPAETQKKQIIPVELGKKGFYPKSIDVVSGKEYEIYLRIVTDFDQPISLQHTSESGKTLARQDLDKWERRRVLPLDLSQGNGLIQEANHPKWVLKINVK